MEVYYYSKMDKTKQAVYHAMLQGLLALEDSIPMPRLEAEDLYQVFFLLRLDHPEIFWATGYKYRYYPESANLVFLPEYLFEGAGGKTGARGAESLRVGERKIRP